MLKEWKLFATPQYSMSKPNSSSNIENTPSEDGNVFSAVNHVSTQLEAIETFIKRRFDELSMEVNATSQQFDMAEEGFTKRFTEILEVLHAVTYSGDGTSAANTGVELEAVVDITEEAANKILDAADRIADSLRVSSEWADDPNKRQVALDAINIDVEQILLACSFQDLTGQRIKQTLQNIRGIEERLGQAMEKMGIDVQVDVSDKVKKASSQQDVDALFKEKKNK